MGAFDGNLDWHCWSMCFSTGNMEKFIRIPIYGKVEVGRVRHCRIFKQRSRLRRRSAIEYRIAVMICKHRLLVLLNLK